MPERNTKLLRIRETQNRVWVTSNPLIARSGGGWFQSQVMRRWLLPVCRMSYKRRACFGDCETGPIRLTYDRKLSGSLTSDWLPEVRTGMPPIVEGGVICKFKFRETLPHVFKAAIQEFQLTPGGFSKYRNCMAVLTRLRLHSETHTESRREADHA